MLVIDGKDDVKNSSIMGVFPSSALRTATRPSLTLPLPALQAQSNLLLPNCSPVKHAPLLVWCRQNPALVCKWSSPTWLLAHTAKVKTAIDANYQFGIFWFNKKLLLLCWTNTLRTFSRFPLWDLAFVHKHTTLQSFTLPHTSTTVIQTAERWERLRINCSCMKPFINNAYCCFLLLPTALRG